MHQAKFYNMDDDMNVLKFNLCAQGAELLRRAEEAKRNPTHMIEVYEVTGFSLKICLHFLNCWRVPKNDFKGIYIFGI